MTDKLCRRLLVALVVVLLVCSLAAPAASTIQGDSTLSGQLSGDGGDSDDGGGDDDSDDTDDDSSTDDGDADEDADAGSDDTDDDADEDSTDDDDDGEDRSIRDRVDTTTDAPKDVLDGVENTTEDTTDTTSDITTSAITESISTVDDGLIEFESLVYFGTTESSTDSDGALLARLTWLSDDTDAGELDADDDGEDQTTVALAGGDGQDGQPLPPAPATGGAVLLGAVAAVSVVRGSPFVTGVSMTSTSTFPTISTLLDRLRPFVLPLRYSRFDDSDPLEHEARERVYQIIKQDPGAYLSAVSDEADLPLSTTRHHIRILEREDLVSGAKLRGKRRFYPAYADGIELAAAMADEATATIIDAIARLGTASVSDLADTLDRDPSTISHHLQRLEEDDIITREREGRAVMNKLSADARTALEPDQPAKPVPAEVPAGGAD